MDNDAVTTSMTPCAGSRQAELGELGTARTMIGCRWFG
jgi:hypothetical protein